MPAEGEPAPGAHGESDRKSLRLSTALGRLLICYEPFGDIWANLIAMDRQESQCLSHDAIRFAILVLALVDPVRRVTISRTNMIWRVIPFRPPGRPCACAGHHFAPANFEYDINWGAAQLFAIRYGISWKLPIAPRAARNQIYRHTHRGTDKKIFRRL